MFLGKLFEEFFENFISLVFAFTFSFCIRKKKITKRKTAGCRSRAKKSSYFPKRKELATLKQLFVLNGKYSIFLNALPRRPGGSLLWRLTLCFARWMLLFVVW